MHNDLEEAIHLCIMLLQISKEQTLDTWHPFLLLKVKFNSERSSHCGTAEMNLSRNHELVGSIPGLAQWVKDLALP